MNDCSTQDIPTIDQFRTFIKYGFFNVEIIEGIADDKVFVTVGEDGLPDRDYIRCNPKQAAEIEQIHQRIMKVVKKGSDL